MPSFKPLSDFFDAIHNDSRVTLNHIGVYAVLLHCWQENNCVNPVRAYSYEIMKVAKLSAGCTYHRYVRDLHDFGYIRYEPSFNKNQRSRLFILAAE